MVAIVRVPLRLLGLSSFKTPMFTEAIKVTEQGSKLIVHFKKEAPVYSKSMDKTDLVNVRGIKGMLRERTFNKEDAENMLVGGQYEYPDRFFLPLTSKNYYAFIKHMADIEFRKWAIVHFKNKKLPRKTKKRVLGTRDMKWNNVTYNPFKNTK